MTKAQQLIANCTKQFKPRQIQLMSRLVRAELRFHTGRLKKNTSRYQKIIGEKTIAGLRGLLEALNTSKEA